MFTPQASCFLTTSKRAKLLSILLLCSAWFMECTRLSAHSFWGSFHRDFLLGSSFPYISFKSVQGGFFHFKISESTTVIGTQNAHDLISLPWECLTTVWWWSADSSQGLFFILMLKCKLLAFMNTGLQTTFNCLICLFKGSQYINE